MQDNRRNVRRFLGLGVSKPAFFAILTATVGAMLVLSMLFSPSSTTKVNAAQAAGGNAVSADALALAFNFKSGGGYTVYGGHGIRARGNRMNVRGTAGSAGAISGAQSAMPDLANPNSAREDLRASFGFINQLPCNAVDSADLGGKSFGPGVYCLSSASLAGAMTLDAGGNTNAMFVFRISGDFSAADSASVNLANGASAYNAYFVSSKSTIGANSDINASLLSDGDITVNDGSSVSGKTISVNGDIIATNSVLGQDPGFIEICKDLTADEIRILPGTIFTFTVAGRTIQVPAGSCSGPLQVDSGNVVVTEAFRADTVVTNIRTTLGNGTPAPDRLVTASLPLRTATVVVPAGTVQNETIVRFTNTTARTTVIEICKNGEDLDVTGPWQFVTPGNLAPGGTTPITVFTGSCSGPITVQLPTQVLNGQLFNVTVREIGRETFIFDPAATTTLPNGRVVSSVLNNDNGGTVVIQAVAGATTANQTTVFFNNRSLPGRIKVCKITADEVNIPVGARFQFDITGQQTVGGEFLTERVEVRAGPDSQGGFCTLSNFNYVVGTAVRVSEVSVTASDLNTLAGITPDMVRVSRIRSTAALTINFIANPASGVLPNPYATATTIQRNSLTSIDFTNFVYRPAILKVCKTVTGNIPAGTTFNFAVTANNPLVNIITNPTINVSVSAGGCSFANGPFPATANFAGIGTFNAFTTYTVTEAAVAGTSVTAITSPTVCLPGDLTTSLANRSGSLRLCQQAPNFNEITFNNAPAVVPPPAAAARYDFDGDHRSDPVIFRPSTGTWWFAASSSGGQANAAQWGQTGDRVVAADYDGDGKADYAVYRGDGNWYVNGSSRGFFAMNFGLASDVPQPGDYDGDGKADFAVYRPSNGAWYIMGSTDGFKAFQFGISTDLPEAADYDGDGRMDAAVYRSGVWYILGSRDGFSGFQFGIASDSPVPADYDGDGKADAAVYRGGVWHILGTRAGYIGYQWGMATDTPVPADYDGDGKTDMAVYRSGTNTWYITQSGTSAAGSFSSVYFGTAGDVLMSY